MLLLCTKCSLASTMATIPQNPSRANHSPQRFIIFSIREAFKCTKAAWQLRQILSSPKRILILALYIWWNYISENQRTCQRKAHTSSTAELLAPQRGTYENWATALQCQGDFTEHVRKVSPSWPETQGKEMSVIMYSWASTVQRLLNQWYGVHCWCSVVKMFTICVTLSLLWTLMEPSNIKAWGWGTNTQWSQSTWKSLLAVYYIRKFWHKMKNGSKPKHEHFQAELRRAAQPCITLPWRSSSELSGTGKSFRYWEVALVWTPERDIHSSNCKGF